MGNNYEFVCLFVGVFVCLLLLLFVCLFVFACKSHSVDVMQHIKKGHFAAGFFHEIDENMQERKERKQ